MPDERVEGIDYEHVGEAEKASFYEATLAGTNRILEMILEGAPTSATLDAVARLAERLCPRAVCAILTVSQGCFQYGAAPSLPSTDEVQADDELPFVGCGVEERLRRPVGTTDVTSDPNWAPWRDWAERHGLRACFSWPICDDHDELLAIFTMYFRESRNPDWFEQRMLERAAHLVGVVLTYERASSKLKLSEKRFRTLVQTTTDSVWVTTPDGMVISDPEVTWGVLTGQSVPEQVGRGWVDAVHPDDRDRAWKRWKESFENLVPYEQTYRVRKADGTWGRIIARGMPLLDADGRVCEWIGTATDITSQYRAENRLRFLADAGALLDTSSDYTAALSQIATKAAHSLANYCAIVVETPSGGTWQTISSAAPSLPWGEPEQLRRLDELAHSFWPIDAPLAMTRSATSDPPLSSYQFELLRELEVAYLVAVPLRGTENNVGVVVFADRKGSGYALEDDDVTLAEELARRFIAAVDRAHTVRDLEAAIQARDDFLSVASHELKTPLTPLQLQIQAIERRPQGELPAWLIPRLRVIRNQVERFARLVDQLLDISRIAEGKFQLELAPVDLDQVVRDVVARFDAAGEISRAGSVVELTGEPDLVGHWDRLRLEQVVTNLLSNALKYGERKPIGVEWRREADKAVLSVRDLGIGIAIEDQDRIFTRFERAVSVRHYGGFGLGLFIVRQLVEAMGGKVTVASTPGQGATFQVVLPLAPREPAASKG